MLKDKIAVLVVEDELPMLEALTIKLKAQGYLVYKAMDGEQGLEIANRHHPDLIMIDILLPKKDGLTMMKEMRQTAWGKHTPMILLTNVVADDAMDKQILELQPAYYLEKAAWSLEKVMEKVEQALKK